MSGLPFQSIAIPSVPCLHCSPAPTRFSLSLCPVCFRTCPYRFLVSSATVLLPLHCPPFPLPLSHYVESFLEFITVKDIDWSVKCFGRKGEKNIMLSIIQILRILLFIFILYSISPLTYLFDDKIYMLIICSNHALAVNLIHGLIEKVTKSLTQTWGSQSDQWYRLNCACANYTASDYIGDHVEEGCVVHTLCTATDYIIGHCSRIVYEIISEITYRSRWSASLITSENTYVIIVDVKESWILL